MVKEYIRLMRINQWYKNIVIFLPLIFLGELFSIPALLKVALGFIALCLVSSTNYVLNDIADLKRDRLHPEKKNRPIAKGNVSVFAAGMLAIFTFAFSIWISLLVGMQMFWMLLILFALTQVYSFYLKHEIIIDVIMIGVNFVLRAVAGSIILGALISPWLILCPFFLALTLAVGKRESEINLLSDTQKKHNAALKKYTNTVTHALMIVSTTSLIISYSLYSFSKTHALIITMPFAIYTIFRYYYLVMSGSVIARRLELAYKDWRLIIGIILWALILLIALYYGNSEGFSILE